MIKFWTSKYELVPLGNLGTVADSKPRKGALFKVQWPNGNFGYSDIFPWPELGDLSLDEQIASLGKNKLTPLIEQSIWLAKRDSVLRKAGKNAYATMGKIKNHYLVSDLTKFNDNAMKDLRSAGFTTLKIKVGRDIDDEAKMVGKLIRQNPITVRLDFNAKTNLEEILRFFSHLGPAEKPRIEFVEDPVPWDPEIWGEIAKIVPVALDQEYDKVDWEKFKGKTPFSVVVLKPARQDIDQVLKWVNKLTLKMMVSSSLDHPVGVAHALTVAADLKKFYPNTLLDCGCLSLKSYKPNAYSSRIQTTGPYLKEIPGTGIGFDDLFEKEIWLPVTA